MKTAKGYWVIECQDVTDPIAMQQYVELWMNIANQFEAKVIAGLNTTTVEGPRVARTLVVEFPSLALAQQCYASQEYQVAKDFALQAMQRTFSIVEGM